MYDLPFELVQSSMDVLLTSLHAYGKVLGNAQGQQLGFVMV